jgi:acid stress chaperone HdeA
MIRASRKAACLAAAAVSAVAILASCSGEGLLGNRGGDTSCGDFRKQDDAAQNETVKEYLREKNGRDPYNIEVTSTKLVMVGYCETFGRDSDPIRSVETAGRPR